MDVRGRFRRRAPAHRQQDAGPKDIDESTDTYDTIDWLVKNVPNNNGRVGMWGISYPGFYVSSGIIDSHPALKAVSPQAPIGDWFIGDDFHHNGAFFLPHAYNFYAVFGQPRTGPGFIDAEAVRARNTRWLQVLPADGADQERARAVPAEARYRHRLHGTRWSEHPNYDEFWKARRILEHLHNIKPAVLTVGGWFDAEDLYGALNTYASIEQKNPGITNTIVMGPWFHGGWARSDGDRLGQRALRLEDVRILPRPDRAAVLQHLPEVLHRQLQGEPARSLHVRDRLEPVAHVRPVAAEERRAEGAVSRAERQAVIQRARPNATASTNT